MDSLSNFINKLKIACHTGKDSFQFPFSRYIAAIVAALEKAGYVASFERRGKKGRWLEVRLLNEKGTSKVTAAKRVSRLSKRVYLASRDIKAVRNGCGSFILSTSKGVMTGREARVAGVGGEVLFEIW